MELVITNTKEGLTYVKDILRRLVGMWLERSCSRTTWCFNAIWRVILMGYTIKCNYVREIYDAERKAVVSCLSKYVRGYIFVTFDEDDTMVVRLYDKDDTILHTKKVEDIITKAQVGFSADSFARDFAKELKREILQKYFKTPIAT